jgi:Helitron helicase-like domain at N-terminus
VDGMSRALPHSNEAAKSARSKGESMQHQFGIPSVFLTVTFDDENSLVIQVLSGVTIDNDNDMNDLTDDELSNRALQRKDFRLKYPGFGSLNFEILFQVVMEEVVGWNMRRNCATDVPGLFGKCLAAVVAYEEQGRLTVHAHLTIWIENFDSLRYNMFFGATSEKRDAARLISDYFERISTTELIGTGEKKVLQKAFDHSKCSVVMNKRSNPEVVDNQGLRNLRHRLAFTEDGHFAVCPHCAQEFTYENLVGMYCRRVGRIRGDSSISELAANDIGTIPKYRMHAMCIKFQKQVGGTIDRNTRLAVNAAYNSHLSSHVSSCFRCQKKGKKAKHVCGSTKDCECRYRMPDRPRKKACVRYIKDDSKWFEWNGVEKKQPIVEVLPKRVHYDLFQNVSCKAISESKLTCNSNVSIVTDGPIG